MTRLFTTLAVVSFSWAAALNPAAATPVYYTSGHADLGLAAYDDAEGVDFLELHLHVHAGATVDGSPLASGAEYAPDEAIIVVPFTSQIARPADPVWAAVGVDAGEVFWYLPQTQTASVPFLGIGAEDAAGGTFDNDQLELRLLDLSGPGEFSVWQTDTWGQTNFFISTEINGRDNPTANRVTGLLTPSHGHYGWGFSLPGTYQTTFKVYGTINGVPQTDQGTFTFQVAPEPSTMSLLALALGGGFLALRRRRQPAG